MLWLFCLGGTVVLFDRKMLRNFRRDGHNWKKKKDGKTVKEAHEHLKVREILLLLYFLADIRDLLVIFDAYSFSHSWCRLVLKKGSMCIMHMDWIAQPLFEGVTGYSISMYIYEYKQTFRLFLM